MTWAYTEIQPLHIRESDLNPCFSDLEYPSHSLNNDDDKTALIQDTREHGPVMSAKPYSGSLVRSGRSYKIHI